jgi:molybdopterin-guanine dinucleotide biosynthesis protein A
LTATSIILAGGKSSRLGRTKALQVIGDRTLIQWVIDRLVVFSTEIIVVTARGEAIPHSLDIPVRTVPDVHPGKGPLVGLYSGLIASSDSRAVVVGCDTPFLSTSLLKHMAQIASAFHAIVPRINSKVEPLCAVYSKSCLAPIQELLEQNERSITGLFDVVPVRYVEEDEINRFDPEHLSFFNINSQDDLERARKLAVDKGWLSSGS